MEPQHPVMTKQTIRIISKHSNDQASAGGLAGIFILFIVCGIFIAFLGPVVDSTNNANNGLIGATGLPMSQDRISTLGILSGAFGIMAFMILLAAGINYWIVSIRDQSQEV